ncbi:MAG: diamine N-acetyltransferase [Cryomorphaceae bacterium]
MKYLKEFTMLENERIRLRALETTDVDKLFIWENNRVNWRVSQTVTPYSRHILIDYVNAISDVFTDKQLRLIIEEKDSQAAIGTVDIFDCDFKNKRAGIGILVAEPEKRGKGFASEVMEILLPYCFQTLSMHQVYCSILTDNTESIKLFKKFGFEKVGVKKDWTFYEGKFYDEVLMQKFRSND